jgi:hypothetical protein
MCAHPLAIQKDSEGKIFRAVLPCAQQFRAVCSEIFFHDSKVTQ